MNSCDQAITNVPTKSIIVPDDHKKSFDKNDPKTKTFMESVHQVGFLHPIGVRPTTDGKYELVYGRKRLWLAKQMGLETIPAVIKDWADSETDFVGITENIHRHQMSATEEARQNQKLFQAWEKMGKKELPEHVAGGVSRAKGAKREGGRFAKGTEEKLQGFGAPTNPALPTPAEDPTSAAGAQASDSPPEPFATHLARHSGKDVRHARDDAKIARTLTDADLVKLDKPHVTREGLIKIARIEDPAKRLNVIGAVELGMDVSEAVDGIEEPSQDLARAENGKLEIKLSDQEWVEKHCAAMRAYIQDPTSFDIDAAFYRRDRDAKAIYQRDGQTKAIAKARAGKHRDLPFVKFYMRFMFVEHPNNWQTCDECQGQNVDQAGCARCKGAGYKIPIMPEIPQNFR